MSNDADPKPGDDAAASNYFYLGLTALLVILLMMLRRGLGIASLVPVMAGVLGLSFHMRMAPFITLIVFVGLLYQHEPWGQIGRFGRSAPRGFDVPDWILSAAILAYFAAHYRLSGLTVGVLPVDRRRPAPPEPKGIQRPALPAEVGWLILALPIWAFVAQLCWRLLPADVEVLGIESRNWQGIIAAWVMSLALLMAASILGYMGLKERSRAEALLYLQDTIWQETRREQRRVSRWLAGWRARRRKEEP